MILTDKIIDRQDTTYNVHTTYNVFRLRCQREFLTSFSPKSIKLKILKLPGPNGDHIFNRQFYNRS